MTITPLQAIQETVSTSAAPVGGEITGKLAKTLKVLCWIHRIWRGTRTARAATSVPKFMTYLGGVGLNLAYGDRRGVKIAAQTVLIATRVVESIEHLVTLNLYFSEIKREVCGETILPMKAEWKKPGAVVFMSPSIQENAKTGLMTLKHRISRVAYLVAMIVYHIFDLSMCIYDASKGFDIDNEHVSDNINEIFTNGYTMWNKLTTDLPLLAEKLEEHSKVIDVLLHKMSNSPFKTSHLLKVCMAGANALNHIDAASEALGRVASNGLEAIAKVIPSIDPDPRYVDLSKISIPQTFP